MNHGMRAIVLAIVALAMLAGCERYQQASRTKGLEIKARDYVKAVRWANFEAAASFIRRRDGSLPPMDVRALKGVRITHSEMTVSTDSAEATEAQMIAVFDYYADDNPSVRSVTQNVIWWWDPLDQSWYIDGDLPAFE